jgi:hypothetical protein
VIGPPRWSDDDLERDRKIAIERFREERMREPLERYLELFEKRRGDVEDLLETLIDLDLSKIDRDMIVSVLTAPSLLEAFRYLPGPPISTDDLKVVAESTLAPSALRANAEEAQVVFDTVLAGLDRGRFPWVSEGREPTESERAAAVVASAALMATQRLATDRRNVSKTLQEASIFAALESIGFERVPSREIPTVAAAPRPGQFCSESMLGSRKADVVVGLWDGRVQPIEAKVSNSATNSIKRLNNDAAVKAVVWTREFGERQVVPTAVLSGVYNLKHLKAAQERNLTIFWAHDLVVLTDWIARTRP